MIVQSVHEAMLRFSGLSKYEYKHLIQDIVHHSKHVRSIMRPCASMIALCREDPYHEQKKGFYGLEHVDIRKKCSIKIWI